MEPLVLGDGSRQRPGLSDLALELAGASAGFRLKYGRLGRAETILAAAAAHHRLLWIHPFLDGNGRVARLMSHAVLLDALDTGGVWSVG